MIVDIARKLNDPELVASFQRFCGILPLNESETHPTLWSDSVAYDCIYETKTDKNGPDGGNFRRRKQNGQTSEQNGTVTQTAANGTVDVDDRGRSSSVSSSEEENDLDYVITNKFLHYLFEFGASMGNEVFYITFFPYWFWNIDGYVGRRVCIFWCLFMYLGQAAKDIIKWPRPASPPVIRLEKRYALEYGMPSTHAMVGAGLPVSLLILTHERYEYPFHLGLFICIIWCGLVCGSRLYLGMHTVLDVLAGLSFVFGLMVVCFPFLDNIDNFILTHPYAPVALILVPLIMALCYPTLDKWNTARGDTTLILGVGSGVGLGHWFSFQYGFMQRATTLPPYQIIWPTWLWFGQMLLRLALGVVILIATRVVMKLLSYNLVCYIVGVSKEDMQAHKKLSVELPYKLITYTLIAFNSVFLAPQIFSYLGIERETYFTEL